MDERGKGRVGREFDREATDAVFWFGYLIGLLVGLSVSFFFFLYHALKLGGMG